MDSLRCEYDDCMVLTRAIRNWIGPQWPNDCMPIKDEIGQLVDQLEAAGPRDAVFHGRLEKARSLIVLGRLADALDCVDTLLPVVRQIERNPTRGALLPKVRALKP
ncbi:hypothetical protein BJG93_24795 [Paraburkholderia sprentiae WSM5005]|uniref:Uncharacterized protein n=1 Tax=Paraburkholderia sprentiae WSM5005 TaxID=754502 RepID=A0A1I9YSX0_9BURK|nr:hypothetical protein [Paraburkholderia sprentiae]APA89296.1 hypothetical protein BJG93_24795 [Paraburkholderia sprentiae WSM5005]